MIIPRRSDGPGAREALVSRPRPAAVVAGLLAAGLLTIACGSKSRVRTAPAKAAQPAPAATIAAAGTVSAPVAVPAAAPVAARTGAPPARDLREARPAPVVLAYYPSWKRSVFGPAAIQFEHVTHLAHAFTRPAPDGRLVVPAGYVDPGLVAAARARGVKVLMSVGGWGNGSGFAAMVGSPERRRRFVSEALAFLRRHGYDGLDYDWEYAANAAEAAGFAALVRETAEAFRSEAPRRLLTIAAPATAFHGRWVAFEEIAADADLVTLMTYDFHGPGSALAGASSPLRGEAGAPSVEESVRYAAGRGVPPEKLLVGLPFSGHSFAADGPGRPSSRADNIGLAQALRLKRAGWRPGWDERAAAPYLVRPGGGRVVCYDDEDSIAAKCRFIRAAGLRGAAVWEVTQDTIDGRPVLLDVVGAAMAVGPAAAGSRGGRAPW